MSVDVALVMRTQLDMDMFLGITNKVLGYSPAAKADAVIPSLKRTPHELACLLGFKDHNASPSLVAAEQFYDLYSFGFLVETDERDMPAILEMAKMPYIMQETMIRGMMLALVIGTFRQWQTAIKRACKPEIDQMVRLCFDKAYLIFEREGLLKAFDVGRPHLLPDTTFYLEDQRARK